MFYSCYAIPYLKMSEQTMAGGTGTEIMCCKMQIKQKASLEHGS